MHRFRWAVCQLDILKRLKPDVSTIRAALSNLPKTLDETYERIFLSILEEEWLCVQHVFHWMIYHNELFGTNIPLSTLLQAIKESTGNRLPHYADQFDDFEGLRERCDCLIIIDQETVGYKTTYERSTVSFAHYTVKEYLKSSRIIHRKVGFFALWPERIHKEFAQIALHQALAFQPGELPSHGECNEVEHIQTHLDGNFKLYCMLSSMLQLTIWSEAISSDVTSIELSGMLINPQRPAYSDFAEWINIVWDKEITLHNTDHIGLYPQFHYWTIEWMHISDPKVAVFLNFLLASGWSGTTSLALAFAKEYSVLSLLLQRIEMEKLNVNPFNLELESHKYKGSIPEIVVSWSGQQPHVFQCILDLISAYGVRHFDLSTLLLLYITGHLHQHLVGWPCFLKKLLSFGASANGPEGAFVTPLQIAVSCWDLHGVEILIEAGADIDGIGGNGFKFEEESVLEQFNDLHGKSPLHIVQYCECSYTISTRMLDETAREEIETLLIECGAVAFPTCDSESGFDDVPDGGEDNECGSEKDLGNKAHSEEMASILS